MESSGSVPVKNRVILDKEWFENFMVQKRVEISVNAFQVKFSFNSELIFLISHGKF